jgi:hypothetical protein
MPVISPNVAGRRSIALFVLLTLAPMMASAQTVASNFQELRFKVKPGDTVYVTDDAGRERKARILDLSPALLVLSVDRTRRDLSENNVKRIRQRLPDPLLNGAMIGAASVMTLSTVSSIAFSDRSENETFGWADVGFILYLGAIGAGVGTGIDALIQGRKIIYEMPDGASPPSFGVSPVLSPGVRGVRVSVSF